MTTYFIHASFSKGGRAKLESQIIRKRVIKESNNPLPLQASDPAKEKTRRLTGLTARLLGWTENVTIRPKAVFIAELRAKRGEFFPIIPTSALSISSFIYPFVLRSPIIYVTLIRIMGHRIENAHEEPPPVKKLVRRLALEFLLLRHLLCGGAWAILRDYEMFRPNVFARPFCTPTT